MNPSIPDTRTNVERLRMNMADEDMAYRFRFANEMKRRARIRAVSRAFKAVGKLPIGSESRTRWNERTIKSANRARRVEL